jgi:hypothetical protein
MTDGLNFDDVFRQKVIATIDNGGSIRLEIKKGNVRIFSLTLKGHDIMIIQPGPVSGAVQIKTIGKTKERLDTFESLVKVLTVGVHYAWDYALSDKPV